MGALILGMIIWNIYLLNITTTLENKILKMEEKYFYLESYNEILKYDLVTARDSLRIIDNGQLIIDNR
ncbi:hypothetical protein [Brumimicrobium mesophilum]|uniref:hypothetical protein n=1 Tax=Brumimicrobium mesophilum TaxID=392717 RepID=UPI000D140753|nr:hypothetical protein [Brumimicrobium mesophilum]